MSIWAPRRSVTAALGIRAHVVAGAHVHERTKDRLWVYARDDAPSPAAVFF